MPATAVVCSGVSDVFRRLSVRVRERQGVHIQSSTQTFLIISRLMRHSDTINPERMTQKNVVIIH